MKGHEFRVKEGISIDETDRLFNLQIIYGFCFNNLLYPDLYFWIRFIFICTFVSIFKIVYNTR